MSTQRQSIKVGKESTFAQLQRAMELRMVCGSFQGRGETGRSIVARLKFLRPTSRTRVQVIAVFFSSPSASNGYSCRRFAWSDTAARGVQESIHRISLRERAWPTRRFKELAKMMKAGIRFR